MATVNAATDELNPRELLKVLKAFKRGNFSTRLEEGKPGIAGEIADILNEIIETNLMLTKEFGRVSKAVGKDGKTSVRANLKNVHGAWAVYGDSLNSLIDDMVRPMMGISQTISAVSDGDFSKFIDTEMEDSQLKGQFLKIANTINGFVGRLNFFTSEVSRVAREVGGDGILGGQADVKDLSGSWKELADNVNFMARNLTEQVRSIADVTTAVANGDLTKKIKVDAKGEILELRNTINTMVDQLSAFAEQVTIVAREVGTEGKLGGQARVEGLSGTWRNLTDNVNSMASNLTEQVRSIADVTTAVANGDLTKKIDVEAQGEILELRNTINTMVDQLSAFADQVTIVAREVGTEGKLGGQAEVGGVAGVWKDLTENVNVMASNLTEQVRSIADVTTAVANGDLSKKIEVDAKGEILELKNTVNTMVNQLGSFADQVTRVAREVGTEGKLGGQAEVEGVAGVWKDLTENVNVMARNLTEQVRNIAEVTTAVANGNLTGKITVEAQGEILELGNTINTMVDQLSSFAEEVTRVAREVGTEGNLGGQADVKGVAGVWRDLTENVNLMANNLTDQVRNIAEVTTAVAQGDLNRKITVDAQGEILALKDTINTMVDQLSSFAEEVTRVAREVGTEGKLGGQADVQGVAGVWRDLTENVNLMGNNLTEQVRNIAEVTTAVAQGDLTRKITVDAQGEILALKNTINTMVDQLSSFAEEVTRVAREVGTEGELGGQAQVRDVMGIWKDLTQNVNIMASNLTEQVRSIAEVTTAVANGDLSKKITVKASGEILQLRETINVMVDQLSSFAEEVTRVAREVGTDGELGGQANVRGVAGVWRDLTENVNSMARNLTDQVRNIAEVTTAVAQGDLTRKITVDAKGEILTLKATINAMVEQLSSFAEEVTRVSQEVGTEGKLGGQARVSGTAGVWKDLTENVNSMARNLTDQVRNIAEVMTAVAGGDLSKKITVDAKGEILELKDIINIMVDQLSSFAEEVTRVARDVGTEGQLGGQAQVKGVAGIWKDLTDNVNTMGDNLTDQVRGIAQVVTAIANGDLSRKLALQAKGEIATLAETINSMIETLATFASQVTTVAREVGVEGKLGGQALVPGAAGTWRDLTDNVNQLAGNLTTQVRAMSEVATAVTEGDLTRTITVEAQGEVEELKNKVNVMISRLGETTRINQEQDWLKTNLADFSRLLQGQKDLDTVSKLILAQLAPVVKAQHGVFYLVETENNEPVIKLAATYAYKERKHLSNRFKLGEGLVGECALERTRILVTDAPDDYVKINSGLGEASPLNIVVLPVQLEDQVLAVIELASFTRFNEISLSFLDQLVESVGVVLNSIAANMRTEQLLEQSQSMADELKRQQEELQQTNEELEEKARLLADQNEEVERKNVEIEKAKEAVEDKAQQLSLTSKYKSQFLANMSHELRTPLNSLMLLASLLEENAEQNLTEQQIEHAKTINAAGADLLALINDVLDLARIEAGTMRIETEDVLFSQIETDMRKTFEQTARQAGLDFTIALDANLPNTMRSDRKRIQQMLKNLLSNAFKFTEQGSVTLNIAVAQQGWSPLNDTLNQTNTVIAFAVTDTGIGIAVEKQRVIFEAFQQVDGTLSRKYGGTGLGLAITREIVTLLGGDIQVKSAPQHGSTFTVYLPGTYSPSPIAESDVELTREVPSATDLPLPDVAPASPQIAKTDQSWGSHENIGDDRAIIQQGDLVVLIVEDDTTFAGLLLELAHQKGFKGVVETTGSRVVEIARGLKPAAVTLDIRLPDINGWAVLDLLKHNPDTRHIPVHVISVVDEQEHGLKMGVVSFLEKPVSKERLEQAFDRIKDDVDRPIKHLLIVEDDDAQRRSMLDLLSADDVEITMCRTGRETLTALNEKPFDCLVLDLMLPDISGFDLVEHIRSDQKNAALPIIVYTAKELTAEEENQLKKRAESIIIKEVKSPERLLDETALFLHRIEKNLSEKQQEILSKVRQEDLSLSGKTILIVDDDIRNIFAITSVLERYNAETVYATNGRAGLALLQEKPNIDLVLMDIMMPEMDGYEATRAIREQPRFKDLPVIALTAKAMKEDRQICIEAGASDYIAKPVNMNQLLSLLRVWLYK